MPRRVDPAKAPGLAQIRAHERIAGLRTDKFSPTVLRLSWTIFLLLHFVCFLYFAFVGWCYWNLPNTRLDRWLSMLYIGMGTKFDTMIGTVHAGVAIAHAAYLVWMIGWSYRKKTLVFAIYNVIKVPSHISGIGDDWPVISPMKDGIFWVYRAVFTRDGFLGVDGPNFDVVLLCREIVETALQTQQAYRMSHLLPRTSLNRGYVTLLVVNCWSTALVHSVFHENATRRRLVALICDCVLDLVCSVGITTILMAIYIPDFDFSTYGFPFLKWYEDVWRVHAMSEFQMILVSSWGDLTMRFVFAMSMIGNLNNMKKLMRARPRRPTKHGASSRHRATVVAPFRATLVNMKKKLPNLHGSNAESVHYWVAKLTEVGFFLWGLVVLILHVHAEWIPELLQCSMQVRPWFASVPSCSLLELNCHKSGFTGSKSEITAQWSAFDPATVVRVVVRHCPWLEMPAKLSAFSQLKEFKIYNSTIMKWDEDAAVTHTNHPKITTLFLIRVNMTDGELPIGLHAVDFPRALQDIEFCVTNLHSLPEDLDLKWPQYASIYIEASQFEEVPPPIVRLAPLDLSLSMNPISIIPKELFERESVVYLSFGGTLISDLPEDVAAVSSSLYDLNLSDTNLSFFWSWIDPFATQQTDGPPISAGNTPYCWDIEHIFEGKQVGFSVSSDDVNISKLLDASVTNWPTLKSAVSCEEVPKTWYPLEFEDEYSKLII